MLIGKTNADPRRLFRMSGLYFSAWPAHAIVLAHVQGLAECRGPGTCQMEPGTAISQRGLTEPVSRPYRYLFQETLQYGTL